MPKVIVKGSHGVAVRELQGHLSERGFPTKVDGVFGAQTEASLRHFQDAAHLSADGIAGGATWNALLGAPASRPRQPQRPEPHDSYLEQLLRQAGTWVEELNPFAQSASGNTSSKPAAHPAAAARSSSAAKPAAPKSAGGGSGAPKPMLVEGTQRASRISFDGYEDRGWVVKDLSSLIGEQIQVTKGGKYAVNPVGSKAVFQRNECAALAQYFGVPHHSAWRRGPRVCAFKPGELPRGTIIATLRDGCYYSDYSGRSHTALYLSHDDYEAYKASGSKTAGVKMRNQSNRVRIHDQTRAYAVNADIFTGHKARKAWILNGKRQTGRLNWEADGEEYFVLMTR